MKANVSKLYLPYLNKLVEKYNNAYHDSINKNLIMVIILLWLKKMKQIIKLLQFKVNDRVRITTYDNIFSKGYTENWSRELFIINSVLKKLIHLI